MERFARARALLDLAMLSLYGYALERIAIAVFASHRYGAAWRFQPGGVPIAVALVWAAVILSAFVSAAHHAPARVPLSAALLAITLDLMIEPTAVRAGLWTWTPPGQWLAVPVGNFVGWAVIVGVYTWGLQRPVAPRSLGRVVLARMRLAALSIVALVIVGEIWRYAGAERAFAQDGGWWVWAAVLVATAAVMSPARSPSQGGRPTAVFLCLVLAFGIEATLSGSHPTRIAAAGPALVLCAVFFRDLIAAELRRWRAHTWARLQEAEGLVEILMKPRNGMPWSEQDRLFLKQQLRVLARWAPGFVLFLLPGGLVLLLSYAWLLDRRRSARPR